MSIQIKKYSCYFRIVLVFTCLHLQSCNQNKLITKDSETRTVEKLVIFPSYSRINVINKGDKNSFSERLSYASEIEIRTQIRNFLPASIESKYIPAGTEIDQVVINSYLKMIRVLRFPTTKKVEVPSEILNVLDSMGENFGLFILHTGFTRTTDNLVNQITKRRVLAAATIGVFDTKPNEQYSTMISVLIDKQKREVVMYRQLFFRNKNPNDKYVIRTQVKDIIYGYFK